jgi:UDP-glucose 4-epimerase
VSLLRFSNVLGPDITTPIAKALQLPLVPAVLGFDPRLQFVHESDGLDALAAAVKRPARGAVNVASRGTVGLTRLIRMAGKASLPVPSPLFPAAAAGVARLGLPALSADFQRLLRYGRGVDLARLVREVGFRPRFTTVQAAEDYLGRSGASVDAASTRSRRRAVAS